MKLLPISTKEEKFERLVESVRHCRLCSRLISRQKVLSTNNGSLYSKVMFIAEAPGRLGADRTLIPLFGDQAGKNFQRLIDTIGWEREDIFITNAVLCNPRIENGLNDTPIKEEIENCLIYLNMVIEIIEPEYIITLGQKALESLKIIEHHNVELRKDVRKFIPWNDRILVPLYHTSPRALIHRNFFNQLSDFYYLSKTIKKAGTTRNGIKIKNKLLLFDDIVFSKLHEIIMYIVNKMTKVSKFKLAKLIYLIDLESIKINNRLITDSYYIRLYDGPLSVNFDKIVEQLLVNEIRIQYKNRLPIICSKGGRIVKLSLKKEEEILIDQILEKYGDYSNRQLKTLTYLTAPMKRVLRKEKDGISMYGKPIFEASDFEK